ncbi:outer membrane protein [Rhodospirillum centenum]|nr:outer membrane beta-barrel protein [Rhodospirillum centenum]
MTRLLTVGAVAAAALLAAPAAMAESAFDGPYIGAFFAYADLDVDARATVGSVTTTGDGSGDGWTFGAYAGYGMSLGPVYAGLEAEYGLNGSSIGVRAGNIRTSFDAQDSYGVSARLGTVVMDRILVYGRFGRQWTQFDVKNTLGTVAIGSDDRLDGWRYGGGVEYALAGPGKGDNMLVRLEYSYFDYDDLATTAQLASTAAQVDESQIRVGFAYRF